MLMSIFALCTCKLFFSRLFVDQFPLLTTKRVFWRGILEELLWFISVSMRKENSVDQNDSYFGMFTSKSNLDKHIFIFF